MCYLWILEFLITERRRSNTFMRGLETGRHCSSACLDEHHFSCDFELVAKLSTMLSLGIIKHINKIVSLFTAICSINISEKITQPSSNLTPKSKSDDFQMHSSSSSATCAAKHQQKWNKQRMMQSTHDSHITIKVHYSESFRCCLSNCSLFFVVVGPKFQRNKTKHNICWKPIASVNNEINVIFSPWQ